MHSLSATLQSVMKIGIGSDHAGFEYKERIKQLLREMGHEVRDFGTDSAVEPVDYPIYIRPVAEAVAKGRWNGALCWADRAMARPSWPTAFAASAALCWNLESARLGREHNDANVLSRPTHDAGGPGAGDRPDLAEHPLCRRPRAAASAKSTRKSPLNLAPKRHGATSPSKASRVASNESSFSIKIPLTPS